MGDIYWEEFDIPMSYSFFFKRFLFQTVISLIFSQISIDLRDGGMTLLE